MESGSTSGQAAVSRSGKEHLDRRNGLSIVLLAFLLATAVSWHSHDQSLPVYSAEPAPPTRNGVVGFENEVDVLANLEAARELTPREHLVRIQALNVRSTGHVDMSQAGSRVGYLFQSDQGEGPEAKRPPGTLARRSYCGQQSVEITSAGLGAREDKPTVGCEPPFKPLPVPSCGPVELWQAALIRGADAGDVAKVEYVGTQAGPVWRFRIETARLEFTTGPDCKTEVRG
jgi:hypothetical protein